MVKQTNKNKNIQVKKSGKKIYRDYETADLVTAAKRVRNDKITIYKATKLYGVPYNTLKKFINDNEDLDHAHVVKMGRPFALPSDIELRIFSFIIEMQELGFGMTVLQIRKLAYDLAETVNRQHLLNPDKTIASKWWWSKFKERYNLCLREPENLSAYRASMANPVIIQDYFQKLDSLLIKLEIKDKPNRIWNVDETGLSYVTKPHKVVCQVGKKYVYKRTYGERGQIHTLVGCVSADGSFIPPMVIFKGVRWSDNLKTNCLPNSLTRISPKGWINSELFLEWFKFFIGAIPDVRPIVLLMDSHGAHVGPDVVELAKKQQVYLMTFPAHTSHILQPLDVGVYKSLKSNWSKVMNTYMLQHPNDMPNRSNFHELFTPAFLESFTPLNIVHCFKKAGACPFDPSAILNEALAPSKLTDSSLTTPSTTPIRKLPFGSGQTTPSTVTKDLTADETEAIERLLEVPHAPKHTDEKSVEVSKVMKKGKKKSEKKKKDSSAKCLNPPEEKDLPSDVTDLPNVPGIQNKTERGSSDPQPGCSGENNKKNDDDWECGVCCSLYSMDCLKKTGAKWIQCSFCKVPYHEKCQKHPTKDTVYMCDNCENDSYSEDSE